MLVVGATAEISIGRKTPEADDALGVVRLNVLKRHVRGSPDLAIGLIDGPIDLRHAHLEMERLRIVPEGLYGGCLEARGAACAHGTFVAGVLHAKPGTGAPAICPECSLLVRPIFPDPSPRDGPAQLPRVTPHLVADALLDVINAGARVVNLSVAFEHLSVGSEVALERALDHAAARGVIVVAAAGNQAALGSSAITRHSWVLPVIAYDLRGRVTDLSNVGHSIGQRGIGALGEHVTSLGPGGGSLTLSGTSVAAPFVTGTIALLWSVFPDARPAELRWAVTHGSTGRRRAIVPPLLDAWGAYRTMEMHYSGARQS